MNINIPKIFNPYLLHFGNIQERHLWKKNPKFTFWSLMTSYMTNNLWRHMNLKLHQLGYLYVTWPESRDVISGRYHVMKLITPENPGNELASFLEKISKIYFLISDDVIHGRLLMTSHKSETILVRLPIRHMTSITWRHQREISRDESHYSRKTGNWASVIFGKKSRRVWEPLGASFMEKNPKNGFFG